MMTRRTAVLAALIALAGCGKDEPARDNQAPRGLPPAGELVLPEARGGQVGATDPHAGMAMTDPHAGIDMGGGVDPHGGLSMGAAGPPQSVDPSKFLKGTIRASKETAALIEPGSILFLSVKPIDPLSGEVIGNTIAVDRLDIAVLPIDFALTGADTMIPGTKFEGSVLISARVDQDGEARSKQPGDIEGSVKATIPAEGITLSLDTILK